MVTNSPPLKLALPKGRMAAGVETLLREAGMPLETTAREYRPTLTATNFDVKLLKPQNIVEMLARGSRDLGFAGADWVAEKDVELVEVLDTGLDPVRLVLASPQDEATLSPGALTVATEYANLANRYFLEQKRTVNLVRSYGATEVFPPEDADAIIDIVATGKTLAANRLQVRAELMSSSTRLYASREAYGDPSRRQCIEDFGILLRSVLDARQRVMVELNVARDRFEALVQLLPCMKQPTVAELYGESGYAIKAAVPTRLVPGLIAQIRQLGGEDIVVTPVRQLIA